MKLSISSAFDAGNIEVINTDNHKNIQFKIRKDTESDFLQCFYFRMQEAKGQACNLNLINAGEATYPEEKLWVIAQQHPGESLVNTLLSIVNDL